MHQPTAPPRNPRHTHSQTAYLAAVLEFFEREGHLTVPHKHVETALSAEQGRRAVPGAGGAAAQGRDAVVMMTAVAVTAAAACVIWACQENVQVSASSAVQASESRSAL